MNFFDSFIVFAVDAAPQGSAIDTLKSWALEAVDFVQNNLVASLGGLVMGGALFAALNEWINSENGKDDD